MKKLFALLLALAMALAMALGACKPAKPSPSGVCDHVYFVSRSFPALEQDIIEQANVRWNEVTDINFCTADGENDQHGIKVLPYGSDAWKQVSQQFDGLNVFGVYYKKTDSIQIVDGLTPDIFAMVALHELGHAHGLAHVVSGPAIMNPGVGATNDLTELDMAECRRVDACPGGAATEAVAFETADTYVFAGPRR